MIILGHFIHAFKAVAVMYHGNGVAVVEQFQLDELERLGLLQPSSNAT